jgi:hypothetical protein
MFVRDLDKNRIGPQPMRSTTDIRCYFLDLLSCFCPSSKTKTSGLGSGSLAIFTMFVHCVVVELFEAKRQ